MNSQRLDETSKEQETRSWQTKEEAGKVLKHEDELQDISNMDLAKVQKNKPEGSKEKSQEQTKYQEGSQENKSPIGEMKRQVADKLSELQSKGQEKGEELKEKTQGYFDKALGEFESKQIQKSLQEVNIEPGTKQHIESGQLQGKQVLTDQKKREILDLTQQLTEKVQKLKQTEGQTQPRSYSQDNTQNLSDKSYSQTKSSDSSNQHKDFVSDQSEGRQQETKQKVIQGAQDISGKISEKVEDLKDNLQSEKKKFIENKSETLGKAQEQGQIQKETQYYKERQPIVDQILGRIHAVSDNIHHQVEDFKNVFKVEEGKNEERVPLIDQFTHNIHNVTDKISHGVGALKPKGSSTQPEKREEIHQTQESQLSRKLSGSSQDSSLPQGHSLKQKVQEGLHNITNIFSHSVEAVKSKLTSAKKQKENLEEQQYTERNIHYYKVGEEFREIIAGFSHTVDEAFQEERVEELNKVGIQENPFEPFGEKDIKITPHPHGTEGPQDYEEDLGQEYLDFKIQGIKDLHAEGKGNDSASQNIEQKTSNEDLATELKGNTSSADKGVGHEYQAFKTQGSRNEDKSSGVTYPSKTKESIRDSGADIGYKYQDFKTQGFEDMRNEGSKGNEPAFTESRSVIDRAREEIEKVDKLLQSSILNAGKSTEKIESKEPTLIKSQGTITQAYKDLGTQTEGIGSAKNYASDLTRRANEGVDKNDKLLENAIQSAEIDTGKMEFKENIEPTSIDNRYQNFNQSVSIDKNTSYLTQKVNEDVNRNDMLLNKIIYTGESIQPGETSQSLSTDIYSQGQALGSQKFRDITNEVAGSDFSQKSRESLIEKARKDLEYTDKLLENSIREGGHTTSFGIGSEDKENISIPKSSKVGTEKTTFGQSELRNVPQNI